MTLGDTYLKTWMTVPPMRLKEPREVWYRELLTIPGKACFFLPNFSHDMLDNALRDHQTGCFFPQLCMTDKKESEWSLF